MIIHELNDLGSGSVTKQYDVEQKSIITANNIELDPTKISEDDDVEINALEYRLLVQKIFKAVVESISKPLFPR